MTARILHGEAGMLKALWVASAMMLQAQEDSSFWQPDDGHHVLVAAAITGAVAVFDERIARWTRQPRIQGDSARHALVSAVTMVNEVPLTAASIVTYGIGKVVGSETTADVGLHLTEALLATELIAEAVRIALGRTRPRASPDNAFAFKPGRGLTVFEHRAFPSLHAAVAFATAGALAEEMRLRHAGARRYATVALYGAAMIPGLTRLYLDQHWASDVVLGSMLGAFLGTRVVRYTHTNTLGIDRILLSATPVPGRYHSEIAWAVSVSAWRGLLQ